MKTGQENINYSGRCTTTNENIKNNGMTYKRTTDKNYANQKPEAKCAACTWLKKYCSLAVRAYPALKKPI